MPSTTKFLTGEELGIKLLQSVREMKAGQAVRTTVADEARAVPNAELRAQIEQSRASADAGNLVPFAEVEAQFAARRAKTRLQREALK